MVRVAILGAGVNGMGCAIKIKEKYPQYDVVVLSKEFTPNTTGDGSAGLWYPYLCGNTSEDKLIKWGIETFKLMHTLWLEGAKGVCMLPVYSLYQTCDKKPAIPQWGKDVFGFCELSDRALKEINMVLSVPYSYGITFVTFTFEPSKLLPLLMQRFKTLGGVFQKYEVTSLQDPNLRDFDVVVNCTGLEAKTVTPDDKVFPIRGQVCKVKAPWVNNIILDDNSGHYVIPNVDVCVLGGTRQENNYNTNIDNKDTMAIVQACTDMLPGLKHSLKAVEKHWAGLRPGRTEVRLEAEQIGPTLYIHNYGHGGSGVTLFWGCASEVLELFDNFVPKLNKHVTSKL